MKITISKKPFFYFFAKKIAHYEVKNKYIDVFNWSLLCYFSRKRIAFAKKKKRKTSSNINLQGEWPGGFELLRRTFFMFCGMSALNTVTTAIKIKKKISKLNERRFLLHFQLGYEKTKII